jgi:hypothetical protein
LFSLDDLDADVQPCTDVHGGRRLRRDALFSRARRISRRRGLPRRVSRVLAVVVVFCAISCAVALFIAKVFFSVSPGWLFHLALAGAMTLLAIVTYLDYKQNV